MGVGQVVGRHGGPVETEASDKVWVSDCHDSTRGSWRQETKFTSRFRLICPPTYISELMEVECRLNIKVNLPREKQALEYKVPINIIAGSSSTDSALWRKPDHCQHLTHVIHPTESYFCLIGLT
ncbi:hypothetical protein BC835DRAFT_742969 [Cytidiella melzeri]|nr:hypothetical protein BC835DRAFT_742969 [Cytidiella melzeri]